MMPSTSVSSRQDGASEYARSLQKYLPAGNRAIRAMITFRTLPGSMHRPGWHARWVHQPPPPAGYAYPAPPVRRRRRWPLRLAIVLVVLAVLVVAADRISAAVAERITSDSIAS